MLHVTSRPKLLVRSCPVVVAHSLPAVSIQSVRESIHSIQSLRARAPIIDQLPVVVAHSSSVPGLWIVLFARARVSSVHACVGLALFMQVWSFALRTSCRSTWLVSILGRADQSCDSNSVRSNHSAWSPARHPGKTPLLQSQFYLLKGRSHAESGKVHRTNSGWCWNSVHSKTKAAQKQEKMPSWDKDRTPFEYSVPPLKSSFRDWKK